VSYRQYLLCVGVAMGATLALLIQALDALSRS
jgi:hypothetical protein